MAAPILIYDTETSGLPDWRAPSDAPGQPHPVQIAWRLHDTDGELLAETSRIIRPDGWEIPAEVAAVHGITTERALAEGEPEAEVVRALLDDWRGASLRVAHNINFDDRIIRIAALRLGLTREEIEQMEALPSYCTMAACTSLVALPPTDKMMATGRNRPKPPRLGEAYLHFFGREMENAHDALGDVRACAELYFHLTRDLGVRGRQEAAA